MWNINPLFFCKVGRFWVGTKGRETGAGILPPEQGSLVSMHDAECLLVKTGEFFFGIKLLIPEVSGWKGS